MTLDKAERERRSGPAHWKQKERWLDEAHARIEELEEAWHAARLRNEELEILRDDLNGLFVEENDRAEGYRRAAIILRDMWRDATSWLPR